MRQTQSHIRKIQKLKRKKFHPLLHHVHKKHRLSYKTLYYIKSYGNDKHVWHAIVKQSIGVLLVASIVSMMGGLWLQSLEAKLALLLPLLVMIPALNDMTGDFGTILSSKFSTYLFTGKTGSRWWRSRKVHELVTTIFIVGAISALYIGIASSLVAFVSGFPISLDFIYRMLFLSVASTLAILALITAISFIGGYMIFRRGDDPNNFLIPITTAIADFGSLTIFSFAVVALF